MFYKYISYLFLSIFLIANAYSGTSNEEKGFLSLNQKKKCLTTLNMVSGSSTNYNLYDSKVDYVEILDSKTNPYSTFHSHVRRHTIVGKNLFITYTVDCNKTYTQQTWKLVQYDTKTKIPHLVYQSADATNPPCIVSNLRGDIFIVYSEFVKNVVVFLKFQENKNKYYLVDRKEYSTKGSGKFSCDICKKTNFLYFFDNKGKLFKFDEQGSLLEEKTIVVNNNDIGIEYPQIFISDNGIINIAWTNVKLDHWHYLSIYYLFSMDGGKKWIKELFQFKRSKLPILADSKKKAVEITRQEKKPTQRWLANFIFHKHKIYFAYSTHRYVDDSQGYFNNFAKHITNYSIYNYSNGSFDVHNKILGTKNTSPNSYDGFFVETYDQSRIFYVGIRAKKLVVLKWHNKEWHIFKELSLPKNIICPYAVSGTIDSNGRVYGTFTDRINGCNKNDTSIARTYIFSIAL